MRPFAKLSAVAAIVVALAFVLDAAAENQLRGTWTAAVSSKHPGQLQLNLYRSARIEMGHSMAVAEFEGLDTAMVQAVNRQVDFKLVRDAGTVEFSGTFNRGLGHGEFTFTDNPEYIAGMKQLGLEN